MPPWRDFTGRALLLSLGLIAAGHAHCVAADPSLPQSPAKRVPDDVQPAAARADHAAAPGPKQGAQAPQKVAGPARDLPPARPASLLEAIADALRGENAATRKARDAAQQKAQAARQKASEQQVLGVEQNYRPGFEQTLYAQLAFLRRVCKPDENQFLDIAKAAKADLHVSLHDYAAALVEEEFTGVPEEGPRAEEMLRQQLASLAETKLGAEKAKLYRQECVKLAELHRHAVISTVVASLDERLFLSPQQRVKLVESLSPKYDHEWDNYCENYRDNPGYWPVIPDPLIVPLLNEKQKGIWKQAVVVSFGAMDREIPMFGAAIETQEIARMVQEVQDGP